MDLSEYELVWPKELFISVGQKIVDSPTGNYIWNERVEWLLTEALAGTSAVTEFDDLPDTSRRGFGAITPAYAQMTKAEWFGQLMERVEELRSVRASKPYWPQRQGQETVSSRQDYQDPRLAFEKVLNGFIYNGYLVDAFSFKFPDGDYVRHSDAEISKAIEERLGIADLWPMHAEDWNDDTFYGLIEVFHDLVRRPRRRRDHPYKRDEWIYSDFEAGPARILYRARVNEMLRLSDIKLELASEGSDLGRLVATTDDARAELVHRVLNVPDADIKSRVEVAVADFRARDASRERKRGAIVTLAGILEQRRQELKDALFKEDERALFEIANKYDLRHRKAGQAKNYDPAFMDWIFWWYLGTVELTERLLDTQRKQ